MLFAAKATAPKWAPLCVRILTLSLLTASPAAALVPQWVEPKAPQALKLLQQQRAAGAKYAPVAQPGGAYRASNPAQGFTVDFERGSVQVNPPNAPTLGLTLQRIGREGRLEKVSPSDPVLSDGRVLYENHDAAAWYRNGPLGLQQGFIIEAAPAPTNADPTLLLELGVAGPYTPRLSEEGCIIFENKVAMLSYCQLFAWDASGRSLPAQLLIDEGRARVEVRDTDALYPIYIDPILAINQKIAPQDLVETDQLGISLAIEGDLAVVGTKSFGGPGRAFIYRKSDRRWLPEAVLRGGPLLEFQQLDLFGSTVSIDNGMVAISSDPGAPCGSVYLYTHEGGLWSLRERIDSERGVTCIGRHISLDDQVLVASESGNVHVYERSPNQVPIWQRTATLRSSIPNTFFGYKSKVRGDHIAVASYDAFGANSDRLGRVFLFSRTEAGWREETILMATGGFGEQDFFGADIAFVGPNRLVVGSVENGPPFGWGTGRVYVYDYIDGEWQFSAQLEADDAEINGRFGKSVGGEGSTIVVGAGRRSTNSAYVFREVDGEWRQDLKLLPTAGRPQEIGFGRVAYSDGTVLVGAPGDSLRGESSGSAFFFDLEDHDLDRVLNADDNCPEVPNADQVDDDGDAVGRLCDGCPDDPLKSAPGVCGCGVSDVDSDNDGRVDCADPCPAVAGECGCDNPLLDTDGDGTLDCDDACPLDPEQLAPGGCGCGTPALDEDGDETPDCLDRCPQDADKIRPGVCGCGTTDRDWDLDGTPNCLDDCPLDPDKLEPGLCGCGTPDPDCHDLDAGPPDAALPDAAVPDAALADAATPDAAVPYAATPDIAVPDAATPDVAVPDAAVPDAATPDAAVPDAMPADTDAIDPRRRPSEDAMCSVPSGSLFPGPGWLLLLALFYRRRRRPRPAA